MRALLRFSLFQTLAAMCKARWTTEGQPMKMAATEAVWDSLLHTIGPSRRR